MIYTDKSHVVPNGLEFKARELSDNYKVNGILKKKIFAYSSKLKIP